jgi:hypothetical protein
MKDETQSEERIKYLNKQVKNVLIEVVLERKKEKKKEK